MHVKFRNQVRYCFGEKEIRRRGGGETLTSMIRLVGLLEHPTSCIFGRSLPNYLLSMI